MMLVLRLPKAVPLIMKTFVLMTAPIPCICMILTEMAGTGISGVYTIMYLILSQYHILLKAVLKVPKLS